MKYQVLSIKYRLLRIRHFIKIVFFFILYTLYLIPYTKPAFAQEISLGTSPSLLQIELIPPADAHAPFSIQNLSNQPVDLTIGYKLFKASEKDDGQIEYLKDSDPFTGGNTKIFEQIEVVDEDNFSIDTLSLGPKQKKNLILRVVAPKKEPLSDYYFSLIFLSEAQNHTPDIEQDASQVNTEDTKQKRSTASSARAGIAINVLLSIGPKDTAKGYIEEFSTPWYREAGPVPFTVKVKNTGAHFIRPKGIILIKNMFGQTVGRLDLTEDNILTATSRYLTTSNKQQGASNKEHPEATWPDTFLLGTYTAELHLALSEQGPIYTRSVHFVAMPVKILLGITVAILVVILAYLRIRNKINSTD